MAVEVRFIDEAGVVEMVYTATTTPGELDAAMTRAGTLEAEMLTNRYLVDCRRSSRRGRRSTSSGSPSSSRPYRRV